MRCGIRLLNLLKRMHEDKLLTEEEWEKTGF